VSEGAAGAGADPGALADRVEIRGLRLEATHGVTAEERSAPQTFEVDLDLYLRQPAEITHDELGRTADYTTAIGAARRVLEGPPRRLLETLAEEVAAAVLADEAVAGVTVAVRKLSPPVPEALSSAGVRVTRGRL
jgi:dihydroneopterin aldolase